MIVPLLSPGFPIVSLHLIIVKKRRIYRGSSKCKHCDNIKTVSHLYHCDIESQKTWRLSYITTFWKKLKEIKTDESLTEANATILTEYLYSGRVTRKKYHLRYHNAIDSQIMIGFDHFFLGKISQQWLDLYLPNLPSDPSQFKKIYGIAILLKLLYKKWSTYGKLETGKYMELIMKKLKKKKDVSLTKLNNIFL